MNWSLGVLTSCPGAVDTGGARFADAGAWDAGWLPGSRRATPVRRCRFGRMREKEFLR